MTRALLLILLAGVPAAAQVAVRGATVYTMSGPPIADGVVVIQDGKIVEVGPAASVTVPDGFRVLQAEVVTPGLVDAHSTIGLTGYLNQRDDQEQLERSAAMQPELRAIDAYNPRDVLVGWALGYGVTTIHTGHGPGALLSGQTMIVKTRGGTVEEALVKPGAMIAATLGDSARAEGAKSPGTRAKMAAMLREELLKAQSYARKVHTAEADKKPPRDLRLEALAQVLAGKTPLLVTAQRSRDISTALRIREEFGNFPMVLDGAAEAYEVLDQILASGVPVIVHPTMYRATGETENLSFETASKLRAAGIPFALQSGFEAYVPKSRLVLFEAAVAAANGLTREQALASITIDAARLIGVADRVGSLEVGKDGDVALYDGDPFEYTSHCVGVVIEGRVVSEEKH
jgi:imidazolonepropionase-like amidohydrolase